MLGQTVGQTKVRTDRRTDARQTHKPPCGQCQLAQKITVLESSPDRGIADAWRICEDGFKGAAGVKE